MASMHNTDATQNSKLITQKLETIMDVTEVKKYDFDRVVRMVLTAITVVVLIAVIDYLSPVLLPFVVGFILAYMLNPFVEWVQRVAHISNRMVAVILSLPPPLDVFLMVTRAGFLFLRLRS